jgi:hypothetical protein
VAALDVRTSNTPAEDRPPRPRSRRWRAAGIVLAIMSFATWWWMSTPRFEGGGFAGAWSDEHDILRVNGPGELLFILPANEPGTTSIAFEMRNTGRLPLTVRELWPDHEYGCFWVPAVRAARTEPATMYSSHGGAQPAEGLRLPPGGSAVVYLTGGHEDPAGCRHDGMTSVGTVEVVASVAGRTSTTHVPLGYRLGWADDPTGFAEQYGVEVLHPTPP